MSEAAWVSAVNLAVGGRASAGMQREQREAHARLAALPKFVHVRPEPPTQAEQRAARDLGGDRAGIKHGPRSRRGIALDIQREIEAKKR